MQSLNNIEEIINTKNLNDLIAFCKNADKEIFTSILYQIFSSEWIEGLEYLYSNNYYHHEDLILKIILFCGSKRKLHLLQNKTSYFHIEKWLLSKHDSNHISLNNIDCIHSRMLLNIDSNEYWNVLFNEKLAASEHFENVIKHTKIQIHLLKNKKEKSEENFQHIKVLENRLLDIFSKNIRNIHFHIMEILLFYKDDELFKKIISCSKTKLQSKDLFIIMTLVNSFFQKGLNDNDPFKNKYNSIFASIVSAGLTGDVVFSKQELLNKYKNIFDGGYISFSNVGFKQYSFLGSEHHLESVNFVLNSEYESITFKFNKVINFKNNLLKMCFG